MKKIKKILSVLSAIAVMAAGTLSVSADYSKVDDIVFSKKYYTDNKYYEYEELVIDKNGVLNWIYPDCSSVVVKMKDGAKPPEGENIIIDISTGETIKGNITAEKLSKYQKKIIKETESNFLWGIFNGANNIELTDDLYVIRGFIMTYKGPLDYCKMLSENENVEYAEPVIDVACTELGAEGLEDIDTKGVNVDDFTGAGFIFKLTFENAEQAESFDISSISDFEENIGAMAVIDNIIYFQFSKDDDRKYRGHILNALQNTETVKDVDLASYYIVETYVFPISGIPYDLGDIDRDNKIDLKDIVNLSKHLVKKTKLIKPQLELADVNEDGRVNVFDVISLSRKLLENK